MRSETKSSIYTFANCRKQQLIYLSYVLKPKNTTLHYDVLLKNLNENVLFLLVITYTLLYCLKVKFCIDFF